jgi:hypothetical protein
VSPLRLVAGQKPEQWQRERAEKANKTIYIICRAVEVRVRCSTVELFPIFSLDIASLFQLVLQFGRAVLQIQVGLLVFSSS